MNGIPREVAQELGGRKTPGVTGGLYAKAKSEGVVPEMRRAIGRACALRGVASFAKDLDLDVSLSDECVVGLERGARTHPSYPPFARISRVF